TQDTVVIFSSDNGYFLGEHRSGDKRAAYEESIRIPLLVRYPRLFPAGTTNDRMVLNIDLAPTLLDLAGLPRQSSMQGVSWKDLARGDKAAEQGWRKAFLVQYYKELGDVPTFYGLRTETHKLVRYTDHPEWTELFDLSADPYEMRNLAGDAALLEPLSAQLKALTGELRYPIGQKPAP
ncbi:MAG TPA: sulfatase/phosphatase domain-containing protein, partial [Luteolibacter sp.]|nr:sulfatase/phosphatase domain-containing protein [Luteolibacter sp.]